MQQANNLLKIYSSLGTRNLASDLIGNTTMAMAMEKGLRALNLGSARPFSTGIVRGHIKQKEFVGSAIEKLQKKNGIAICRTSRRTNHADNEPTLES